MSTATHTGSTKYTCPMHPEVVQEGPGRCPKCGMDLVPMQEGHDGKAAKPAAHDEHPSADHTQMTLQMRRQWLWTNVTVMMAGLWLMSSPFTFGYVSPLMTWNDLLSGLLLAIFAGVAIWPRHDFIGRWGAAIVGTWLQFAPLVFWAPSAAAYLNDTLIGALAITLTILVPMMPGMAHHMAMMKPGPEIPPGWTYNPSTWHQRSPMIVLGLIGWLMSRYLAAFQLGYITTVWEPFFGTGTVDVLTSKMSQAWPISDAGLGAVAYTIEMLMAWMGGKTRWRTMPWMVTFFFILVVPLGLTHIFLVISQPVTVDAWCTLCLAAAFVMLLMIPFTVDEVIAMGQFMKESVRNGKPFWRTFWVGDTIEGGQKDQRTPTYGSPVLSMWPAATWGVTAPWTLVLSTILGFWLMLAPAVLGSEGAAAKSDNVVGALVITISIIVMAEVARAGRFLNVLLAGWVIATPWLFEGATTATTWNAVVVGLLLIALAIPRGSVRDRYAGWDSYVV